MVDIRIKQIAVFSTAATAIVIVLLYFLARLTDFQQIHSNPEVALILQILSRFFIIAFGFFLLIDDLLIHNISGRHKNLIENGVVKAKQKYIFNGFHVHHGYVGALLVFMGAFSMLLILTKAGI